MPSHRETEVVVTPEGWALVEFDYCRFFIDYPPPRPHAFLHQFLQDAKHWKVIALWVVGFALILLGMITKRWQFIAIGLLPLSVWVRAFWHLGRLNRHSPLLVGVIDVLEDYYHPMVRGGSQGRARLADGSEASVTILSAVLTSLALDWIAEHGYAEVLLVHDPAAKHSLVIGVRAVRKLSVNSC